MIVLGEVHEIFLVNKLYPHEAIRRLVLLL